MRYGFTLEKRPEGLRVDGVIKAEDYLSSDFVGDKCADAAALGIVFFYKRPCVVLLAFAEDEKIHKTNCKAALKRALQSNALVYG